MRHVVSHTCPRCGLESRRRGWVERHPFAAVLVVRDRRWFVWAAVILWALLVVGAMIAVNWLTLWLTQGTG